MKENEFQTLFDENETTHKINYIKEVQIDTDTEILLPDNYINVVSERLALYSELSTIKDEEKLDTFKENMEDRFGKIPPQGLELLNTIRLKWIASQLGLERIIIKNKECIAYFLSDQQSEFFKSKVFNQILLTVQNNSQYFKIKEKQTRKGLRLILSIHHIESIKVLIEMLEIILKSK